MPVNLNQAALGSLPNTIAVPRFDRTALTPGIVHIGVGNFHRAHQASYLNALFDLGHDHDWAIIGAGIKPGDAVMRERLAAQDFLTTIIELDPVGDHAKICGSMIGFA
ncbi:MAG: mannitol dehydrogenase family protein, partial [Pseudomonadota bacterium]